MVGASGEHLPVTHSAGIKRLDPQRIKDWAMCFDLLGSVRPPPRQRARGPCLENKNSAPQARSFGRKRLEIGRFPCILAFTRGGRRARCELGWLGIVVW